MFSKLYSKYISPAMRKMNTIKCSPADLMFLQYFDGEYCHPDTIVKYLYIENYYGGNTYGKDLYIKQQLARGVIKDSTAITDKFDSLIKSVENNGFDTSFSIGVDQKFYLRDGSHRSAISMYLDLDEIKVNYLKMDYPSNYRFSWFEENGFTKEEISLIKDKLAQLADKANSPLKILLFGSSADEAEEVCRILSAYGDVTECQQYTLGDKQCFDMCHEIVKASDLYGDAKEVKITVKNPRLAVISLKLNTPQLTTVENNELKIAKRFINYRLPVIEQSSLIRQEITAKTFVNDKMLFIPQNFYQNSRYTEILNTLL